VLNIFFDVGSFLDLVRDMNIHESLENGEQIP